MKKIRQLVACTLFATGPLHAATLIEYHFDSPESYLFNGSTPATRYDDQSGHHHAVEFNRVTTRLSDYPFATSRPDLNGLDYSARTKYGAAETVGRVQGLESINLNATNSFTMEGWIYLEEASAGTLWDIRASVNNSGGAANSVFNLKYTADGTLTAVFNAQGKAAPALQATSTLQLNAWTHIAYIKSDSTIKIYINGEEAGSLTHGDIARKLPITLSAITLAGNIQGRFDDFRLSDTALTPEELGYHAPFTPVPEPSTTALLLLSVAAGGWRMVRRSRNAAPQPSTAS
ncbi:MAG TPA: LamG-like jellyroll fold domain-containing protein [Chthoniobacteraceae bacterium]|nr:LamG-like jellyroll fold domain-containing protein [Chthoniobacteraceae bacterium]